PARGPLRDRLLRLRLHGRKGRTVVLASAAACACLVLFSVAFAAVELTASSSGHVIACIGKQQPIDYNEVYVAHGCFCGPGVRHLIWNKPNGHGTIILCKGDPNDGSENQELYARRNRKCYGHDPKILLSRQTPKGVLRKNLCVGVR